MTKPTLKSPFSELDLNVLTRKFCAIWDVAEIADEIQVSFSNRITRSLGRTQPASKIVRLNPRLITSKRDVFKAVVCHELAHIAAQHLHGGSIRPHGREWQALVRAAGHEPCVQMEVELGITPVKQDKCYTHYCPVCHTRRTAKKQMKRWRCGECVANGLSGILEIEGEV